MRVRKLRFCNLHALKGEFAIDFDSRPLSEAGLFAITGDTGSGKSTLLDAITLALYGRIHRYKYNKNKTDEVMTHGTGTCWAEVEFEVPEGIFLARYERRRARGKEDGNLQQARRILSRREKGEWLPVADKQKIFDQRVEALTGLDFDRFTRSALLAQGDFAAFLRAKKDERSAILEQITGTNIYSEISSSCFERYKEEAQKLELLRQKIAMLHLPGPEEEKELERRLQEIEVSVKSLYREREDWQRRSELLKRLQQLREERQKVLEKRAQLEKERAAFVVQQQRLQAYERAVALQPEVQALRQMEESLAQQTKNLTELRATFSNLQKTCEAFKTEVKQAEQHLAKAKSSFAEKKILLAQVQRLDKQLLPVKSQMEDLRRRYELAFRQMQERRGIFEELEQKRKTLQLETEKLERLLASQKEQAASLDKELFIKEQLKRYREILQEAKSLKLKGESLAKELQSVENEVQTVNLKIDEREAALKERELSLAGRLGAAFVSDAWLWLKELDDRLLAAERGEVQENAPALYALREEAAALWTSWKQEREELQTLRMRREPLQAKGEQKRWALEALKERQQALQQTIHALETELHVAMGKVVGAFRGETLQAAVEKFVEGLQNFKTMQADREKLQRDLRDLDKQGPHLAKALQEKEEETQALKAALEKQEESFKTLYAQRSEYLGDRDVDEERTRLEAAVKASENRVETSRRKLAAEQARLEETEKRLQASEQARKKDEKILKEKQSALQRKALKRGFAGLAELENSLLSERERRALQQEERTLREREIRLQEHLNRVNSDLEKISKKAEKWVPEEVWEAFELCDQKYNRALEERGRLQQQRREWQQLAERHKEFGEALRAQEKEYARWHALNELIGSADGKKFRTFAQMLTLRKLVALANRHLQQFNPRYLLKVSPDSDALELDIVDTYQADRRRSVFTLSGGESFLASLALALGLSDMVGRRAQIRSLFIDEGFGSLDASTLDQALSALEQLQSSGKVIGLISHVRALRERIPVQIVLRKMGGGVSTLEVVG